MNIEQGEVFKNYKELCERLGEPVKEGNSKKAQLNEWKQRFSYQKQGHKFIITEVFEQTKQKQVRNKNHKNKVLVKNYLSQQEVNSGIYYYEVFGEAC